METKYEFDKFDECFFLQCENMLVLINLSKLAKHFAQNIV